MLANQGAANRLPMGRIPNPVACNLAYDTGYGAHAVLLPILTTCWPVRWQAAAAMGGSVLVRGVGGLAGRSLTGVRSSPSVAWLREREVLDLVQIMQAALLR